MEINNIKTPEDIFLWMDENISICLLYTSGLSDERESVLTGYDG